MSDWHPPSCLLCALPVPPQIAIRPLPYFMGKFQLTSTPTGANSPPPPDCYKPLSHYTVIQPHHIMPSHCTITWHCHPALPNGMSTPLRHATLSRHPVIRYCHTASSSSTVTTHCHVSLSHCIIMLLSNAMPSRDTVTPHCHAALSHCIIVLHCNTHHTALSLYIDTWHCHTA